VVDEPVGSVHVAPEAVAAFKRHLVETGRNTAE
jgi:hypothetical protein